MVFVAQSLLTVLLGLFCSCRARPSEAGRSWVSFAFVGAQHAASHLGKIVQFSSALLGLLFLAEASQRALFAS